MNIKTTKTKTGYEIRVNGKIVYSDDIEEEI